jgi:hypothetical protein
LLHANKCLLDRTQETTVSLMQLDLKLSFGVGVGLVSEITLPAACSWHKGLSASRGRQLIPLGEQQSFVSL